MKKEALTQLSEKIHSLSSKVEILVKITQWLTDTLKNFPKL